MHPLLASAILLAAAGLLLLLAGLRLQAQGRQLARRLGTAQPHAGTNLRQLGNRTLGKWRWSVDSEVALLLDRLGWRQPAQRARFFALQAGLPVLVLLTLVAHAALSAEAGFNIFLALFAVGIAFLLPKRLLASAVQKRQRQMAEDVSTMLPLLRMFFEVGMTVEQALRVLMTEGREVVPVLAQELRVVMLRVDAGLELGEELRAMGALVEVDELNDAITILEQLLRQGGGAMASLRSLKELIDERRMTALQETVSKLSAKMSGVMVAFLFPALLIVLAGPGFIAIVRALGEMGG